MKEISSTTIRKFKENCTCILNIPTEALFGDISIAFMTDLDEEKLNFLLENKSEQLMQDWNTLYKQLNDAGKAKAIEHLELLTKIPEYRLDNGFSKNCCLSS